jgi:uncharacterized protein (DUF1778 family)
MAISSPEQPKDRRLLSAARETAEETLADQTRFVLNEKQMKDFMEALDKPAREKPRLRKLFIERHVARSRL